MMATLHLRTLQRASRSHNKRVIVNFQNGGRCTCNKCIWVRSAVLSDWNLKSIGRTSALNSLTDAGCLTYNMEHSRSWATLAAERLGTALLNIHHDIGRSCRRSECLGHVSASKSTRIARALPR